MGPRKNVFAAAVFAAVAILLAACATHGAAPDEPMILVEPGQGATGSEVLVTASGFEPGQTIEIGFGPPASEYEVIAESSAGSDGRVSERVRVPAWADGGRSYVFVVAEADGEPGRLKLTSGAFVVDG